MATILIVDDNHLIRQFLCALLGDYDHRLLNASGVEQALSICSAEKPDLVITDVLMPESDGYEFVRQLRSVGSTAQIPVIFYTASYYQETNARALAEACGVALVLPKPSKAQVILEAVNSVLAASRPTSITEPHREFDRDHARLLTDKLFASVEELEKSNAQLRVSERQYRDLFVSNPFPMWIVDENSLVFLAANDAAVNGYGYSREEFLGTSLPDISAPDDRAAMVQQFRAGSSELFTGSGTWKHQTREGKQLDVVMFSQATRFDEKDARLILAQDITERRRADRKLRESEIQLHHLAERLRSAQEEERTRVARHLHDELGQALTAVKMNCAWIAARLPDVAANVAERLQSSIQIADETIATVRRLSTELRPGILDLGIRAAIEWQAEEFQSRSDIACILEVFVEDDLVGASRATEIFRIFQETLTNVTRHAQATEVHVTLRQEGNDLVLEVRDNGRGVTEGQIASRSALGLLGMRERASLIGGTFSIQGSPREGTTVRLSIPLASDTLSD